MKSARREGSRVTTHMHAQDIEFALTTDIQIHSIPKHASVVLSVAFKHGTTTCMLAMVIGHGGFVGVLHHCST